MLKIRVIIILVFLPFVMLSNHKESLLIINKIYSPLKYFSLNDENIDNDIFFYYLLKEEKSFANSHEYINFLKKTINTLKGNGIITTDSNFEFKNRNEGFVKIHYGPGFEMKRSVAFQNSVTYDYKIKKVSKIANPEYFKTFKVKLNDTLWFVYTPIQTKIKIKIEKVDFDYNSLKNIDDINAIELSLIKLFNILKTFYPFQEADLFKDDKIFKKYYEKIIDSKGNLAKFYTIIEEIAALLNDNHACVLNSLGGIKIARYLPVYYPSVLIEIDSLNNVNMLKFDSIKNDYFIEDNIVLINNISIKNVLNKNFDLVSASNFVIKKEKLAKNLLRSFVKNDTIIVKTEKGLTKKLICDLEYPSYKNVYANKHYTFDISNLYFNLCDYSSSYKDFIAIYNREKPKNIFFDLRGRPIYDTEKILSELIGTKAYSDVFLTKVLYNHANCNFDRDSIVILPNKKNNINSKCYFFVNHNTFSYGETIASIIKNAEIGELIGTQTAGSNGDMAMIKLPIFGICFTALNVERDHTLKLYKDGVNP